MSVNHRSGSSPAVETTRTVDYERLQSIARELLQAIGEDPGRDGLIDTPRRFAALWREFIEYDPGVTDTTFDSASNGQIVVVSGMRVYSICEHHLLPFWCDVAVGYIVHNKVIGLSKFARIAHHVAHRLQVQERIAESIAKEVQAITETEDVMVKVSGVHLCMLMRGVKTAGVLSSIVTRGVFNVDSTKRAEFLQLAESTARAAQ